MGWAGQGTEGPEAQSPRALEFPGTRNSARWRLSGLVWGPIFCWGGGAFIIEGPVISVLVPERTCSGTEYASPKPLNL